MTHIARNLARGVAALRMHALVADLVYACRVLRSARAYSAAVVLTLTIGIAGTTAIFSIVDGVLIKPLAFSSPERVVALYQDDRAKGTDHGDVAPANFADWRARSGSFTALAAAEPFALNYNGADGAEQIFNWNVTQDFFRVLDARPALGRLFVPSDFTPGPARVLILTHASWKTRFAADPSIIGRRLQIGRGSATVVGVLAENFDYLASSKMEMYAPKVLDTVEVRIRNTAWYKVVGRVKPGISLAEARADLGRVAAQLAREYPATNSNVSTTIEPLAQAVVGDDTGLEARAKQMEALARGGHYPSDSYLPALARGFAAFERADFAEAVAVLTPLAGQNERIGGSRAQHDLIEFTLLKACLNAGRLEEARQLLSARRPGACGVPVKGVEAVH